MDRGGNAWRAWGTRPVSADRKAETAAFLAEHGRDRTSLAAIAGDASFRRYYRLGGDPPAILMDAPPGKENVRPFIAVSRHLAAMGYSSPKILAADIAAGLVVLEDLGDDKFSSLLAAGRPPGEDILYRAAVDLLVDLHRRQPPARLAVAGADAYELPLYDDRLLLDEANLFTDWYFPAIAGRDIDTEARKSFAAMWLDLFALARPDKPVLVLRDYHADNLMWLAGRAGLGRVGVLDFQDAVSGAPAYDLVSLLQDARRDVPRHLERELIGRYIKAVRARDGEFDQTRFMDAYNILGAQRNTKIIGIFTRLWRRDGKPAYLDLIGRVWRLLERNLECPVLGAATDWFDRHLPAELRRAPGRDGARP